MTALSGRLALPALVLVLLAPAVGWLRGDRRIEDCRDPEALLRVDTPLSHPDVHWQADVLHTFSPPEAYGRPPGRPIRSSYPEQHVRIRELEVDGRMLPVHWSEHAQFSEKRVRAYFYVHGGEPVLHPAISGLRLAPWQLLHGTLPVTTLVIDGHAVRERRAQLGEEAEGWIRDAWRHYRASCGP